MRSFIRLCKLMTTLSVFALAGCGGGGVTTTGPAPGQGSQAGQGGAGPTVGNAGLAVSAVKINTQQPFTFEPDVGDRSDKVIGSFEFALKDETNNRFVRGLDSSNMTFKERRFGSEQPFLVEVEATQSSGLEVTQIDVMYLIDNSFSVVQAGANSEIIEQANNLADEINIRNNSSDSSGLVSKTTRFRTFADNVGELQTSDAEDPFDDIEFEARGGGTALYQGIDLALSDLASSSQPVLFVFTDGRENASRPGYNLELVLNAAQQSQIPIYIAGLGDVDAQVLEQIATTSGGQFFQANSVDQLAQVFEEVLFSIPVEYTVSYRPAQRTGHIEFQFVVGFNGVEDFVVGDFNVDEILGN